MTKRTAMVGIGDEGLVLISDGPAKQNEDQDQEH